MKNTVIGIVESDDGTKMWHRDGNLHREDGPAIEYPDGTKKWYRDGKLHREDGPAVERPNGTKEWWRNGVTLTTQEISAFHPDLQNKLLDEIKAAMLAPRLRDIEAPDRAVFRTKLKGRATDPARHTPIH